MLLQCNMIAFTINENPTADYQQVTHILKNRDFENDFTFAEFHRKEI